MPTDPATERTRPSEAEVEAAWKKAYADIGAGEVDFPPNQWARAFAAALSTPPLPSAPERDCTCLGSCKGAQGLAAGWRCALSKGTPPLPSAEPVANHEEARLYAEMHRHDSNLARAYLDITRATPPAAAQDTGRGISESVRGDIQDATYDALMYFGAHDLHKPTDYLVAAQKVANDIAARAAGGE